MIKYIAATLLTLMLSVPAAAEIAPPVLVNPTTCEIPTIGGSCVFSPDEDGIVTFPTNQIVQGQIEIRGGRTVHLIGGHIVASPGSSAVVAFNNPTNIFVEGMHVDANGQCDVFAIRNQLAHQTSFTFQNVYAEGPTYNNPIVTDGNCHGDLIQYQGVYGGGLHLTVENFVGVTSGQGFFIPRYAPLGNESTTLRNVYIRETNMVDHTYGLMWFWSPTYDPSHQEHAVSLENVNVGWEGDWLPILPQIGSWSGDTYNFQHPLITGNVTRWYPTDFIDLEYPEHTGLLYDRAWFFGAPAPEPDPTPVPEPEPDPVLDHQHDIQPHSHPESTVAPQWFINWCNSQKVRRMTCGT